METMLPMTGFCPPLAWATSMGTDHLRSGGVNLVSAEKDGNFLDSVRVGEASARVLFRNRLRVRGVSKNAMPSRLMCSTSHGKTSRRSAAR